MGWMGTRGIECTYCRTDGWTAAESLQNADNDIEWTKEQAVKRKKRATYSG